jgi:hypothetical protein
VTGLIKKESLAKIVSDVSGMERGYNEVTIKHLNPAVAELVGTAAGSKTKR